MNETALKLEELFKNYGSLKPIKNINSNYLYFFKCKLNKIIKSKLSNSLNEIIFLLALDNGVKCKIFCFNIASSKEYKDKSAILFAINSINNLMDYGEFLLDSDGDINWGYVIDINNTTSKDIKKLLISFLNSLFALFDLLNSIEKEKKYE